MTRRIAGQKSPAFLKKDDWRRSSGRYQLCGQIPAGWTEISAMYREQERSRGPTKDDIGLYVLGDDAQGDSIMWLSHSIRPDSKHFHVRITIYPLEIKDICLG